MTRSLWPKFMVAFGVVIVAGVGLVVLLVSRATAGQFALYVTRSGQQIAARVAPNLEAYYSSTGSWTGVETLLADPWTAQGETANATGGNGNGQGMMGTGQHGQMMGAAGVWAMFGSRLILADAQGAVVADTGDALVGTHLASADLAKGLALTNAGQPAGTLLVVPYSAPASPASDFLVAVNRAALTAGAIAAGLALLVGAVLFLQITRPLRGLAAAAQAIAAGHLGARAPVRSRDEVGQVATSFNQMAEQLERYAGERQNMIADIAHELRTPLAVIQSNLEAMLDGVLPTSPAELTSLHQEALLLNRLIGDLRTVSLAEAGQLQLDRQPIAPGDLVRAVIARFAAAAAEKHSALTVEVGADLPIIQADEQRLGQALANLVDNAVRYTPPGSQVRVSAQAHAGQVVLSVTDDGPGIPAADLEHVFDRFWRGEHSRNRATGGSGLGLVIVKQLVEAHGGFVRVESPPSDSQGNVGGTRFVVTIPATATA
jgi:two-component system OmpR family sensor kinase/two-component system sensor histidine kinase BaeS